MGIQVNWFARSRIFRNMKSQNRFPSDFHPLFRHLHIMVDFPVGMQDRQKIVLNLYNPDLAWVLKRGEHPIYNATLSS